MNQSLDCMMVWCMRVGSIWVFVIKLISVFQSFGVCQI